MSTDTAMNCHSECSEESRMMSAGGYAAVFFVARRMTCWGALFLFGLLMFASAAEPEMRLSPKKTRDEVRTVVEAQLAALRAGNFPAAYALASAGIKAQFDVGIYAAVIRRGYAPLLRSSGADLGVVRDRDGQEAQITVAVQDRQKRSTVYRYWLVREEDGWRVNGVTLEQRPLQADI